MTIFSKSSQDIFYDNLLNRVHSDRANHVFNKCSSILSVALYNMENTEENCDNNSCQQAVETSLNMYNCFEYNDCGYTLNPDLTLKMY